MATTAKTKTRRTRKPKSTGSATVKASVERAPVGAVEGWPVDDAGQPMAKIGVSISEKIPNPNVDYNVIQMGPVTVTRFAKDDKDLVGNDDGNLVASMNALAERVEESLGEQRDVIMDTLRGSSSD